ncbi:hypothetical protein WJX84_000376 [Apatococcus fuscideae]|uniref:Uncharacterized protein n=1 Tax=Apatococcus fuscideae TaxID=2026836 RepID=A0AAW1TAJ4_9CHLO
MAAKLRRDIEKLKSRLQAAPASETVRSVRLEGSGTVKLELAHVRAQPVIQVALIFADTNYPEAAVLLLCDSNDSVNSQLEDLSDAFQDGAALPAIVSAICARLDFPTCLADSSAGQPAAEMDREDEAEGSDIDHVSEGSEEEAEDTDDDAYDVAERDDEDLLKVVFQKVSRWELKEAAITKAEDDERVAAAAEAEATGSGKPQGKLSMQERLAQQRQIFHPREAFSMLSRELKDILQQNDPMLEVDAVDNDVFHWDIHLYEFEGTNFAKGIQRLTTLHGCGFVHLRLHFKRGLHPFHPPTAELLWPRCQRPFAGALSSHPMIQLRSWDPWKPVKELILQLRVFMEAAAEVDVEHHAKLAAQADDAAYSPFECQLAQLEALSQVPPLCVSQFPQLYSARDAGVDQQRMEALLPSSKRQKKDTTDAEKKTFWAAGTGYGAGSRANTETWDAKSSEAAQAARDAELQGLLDSIAAAFGSELGSLELEQQIQQLDLGPGKPGSSSRRSPGATPSASSLPGNVEAAIETVAGSSLLPFLERELAKASFTDLCARGSFYKACLDVMHKLCCGPAAKLLWVPCCGPSTLSGSSAESRSALFGVIGQLHKQADQYLTVMQSAKASTPDAPSSVSAPSDEIAAQKEEEERSLALAELIMSIHHRSSALALARAAGLGPVPPAPTGRTTPICQCTGCNRGSSAADSGGVGSSL